MTSVLSVNIARNHPLGYLTRLCKLATNHNVTQVAFMKRLSLKEEMPKPGPLPYWKTELSTKQFRYHLTSLIYDENSKLVVVEGPPSAGKDKLCQNLADEFGLLYMPPPLHDDIYMNRYGYDIRKLDPKLPPAAQSIDLKKFLKDPNHALAGKFQLGFLLMRYEQYTNALLHLLTTGQGVVLNRSVYSDASFVDTMYNAGYIKKEVVKFFEVLKKNCLHLLQRPHLVIYLDIPPDVTLANIKKSGNQDEINSKVFTTKYLTDLDRATREKCLSWLSSHSEILMYNSYEENNFMDVVHDIESLDLEEDDHKQKFEDWVYLDIQRLQEQIVLYQDKQYLLYKMLRITEMVIPNDLGLSGNDAECVANVVDEAPCEIYEYGYNPFMGHTFSNAKTKYIEYPQLTACRRTLRDFVNCKLFQV
ncbi:NADH dehydrogenase (ubiquinone) subunit ND-42 [Xylocopa sonorina]|uniref:NADH dehydrogenase (ubiquinone) subunit ND-42 n=1 Tax=Xylocopa sonorina TaxID=1818115 RepID=UPI00403ACF65